MGSKSSMPDLGLVRRSRFICDTMGGAAVGRRSGAGGAGAAKAVAAVQWWVVTRVAGALRCPCSGTAKYRRDTRWWRGRASQQQGAAPRCAAQAAARERRRQQWGAGRCAKARRAPARGAEARCQNPIAAAHVDRRQNSYRGSSCRPCTSSRLLCRPRPCSRLRPPCARTVMHTSASAHQRTLQQFSVAQTGCGDT